MAFYYIFSRQYIYITDDHNLFFLKTLVGVGILELICTNHRSSFCHLLSNNEEI